MTQPHDHWGSVYDMVYEKTFGPLYDEFTRITLDNMLNQHGFEDTGRSFSQFAGTGSTYKLYKRKP